MMYMNEQREINKYLDPSHLYIVPYGQPRVCHDSLNGRVTVFSGSLAECEAYLEKHQTK